MTPRVSFVIPCYNLADYLPQCVESILAQDYHDYEVLIMDDQSSDETPRVAERWKDKRIRYVRNPQNLGALRNYNRGIELSQGEYVWLISADDYLASSHALRRMVSVLDSIPRVGYVACRGIGVHESTESGPLSYEALGGEADQLLGGTDAVERLLSGNRILAPGTLVRADCYMEGGTFPVGVAWGGVPIDLIWGGDWYLWMTIALRHDVYYLAEALVAYRIHDRSATSRLQQEAIDNCYRSEIGVLWKIHQESQELGLTHLSKPILSALGQTYGRHLLGFRYRAGTSRISVGQLHDSIKRLGYDSRTQHFVLRAAHESRGDRLYVRGEYRAAERDYLTALSHAPFRTALLGKLLVTRLGSRGESIRSTAALWRRKWRARLPKVSKVAG